MPDMRMSSQWTIRSVLSNASLNSKKAIYNVRLCSLHFSLICRIVKYLVDGTTSGYRPKLYTSTGSYLRTGCKEE